MSEEIKEIVDKLSNRKQETLIQGLRECQLKDIEHPFITKEEYIDKILNYIKDLQQKVEQLEGQLEEKTYLYNKLQTESKYAILQLENIRKEAIVLINQYMPNYASCVKAFDELENILNKGSEE